MGPRRWSRGRGQTLRASPARVSGFNGATAMEPWKRWNYHWCLLDPDYASMGPRRWSRGRVGLRCSAVSSVQSLQWGHGDGAVEEDERFGEQSKALQLQWGHGDGAVEEVAALDRVGGIPQASMGPRRWSRGRASPAEATEPDHSGFNGATAMEPWKRFELEHSRAEDLVLQWGHGDGAVEE